MCVQFALPRPFVPGWVAAANESNQLRRGSNSGIYLDSPNNEEAKITVVFYPKLEVFLSLPLVSSFVIPLSGWWSRFLPANSCRIRSASRCLILSTKILFGTGWRGSESMFCTDSTRPIPVYRMNSAERDTECTLLGSSVSVSLSGSVVLNVSRWVKALNS